MNSSMLVLRDLSKETWASTETFMGELIINSVQDGNEKKILFNDTKYFYFRFKIFFFLVFRFPLLSITIYFLIYLMPQISFYTTWKHQKTRSFLFSGGTETDW